jgi:hypothetical protein
MINFNDVNRPSRVNSDRWVGGGLTPRRCSNWPAVWELMQPTLVLAAL